MVNLETFLHGIKSKSWWKQQHLLIVRYTLAGSTNDFDADHDESYFRGLFLADADGVASCLRQLSGGEVEFSDVGPVVAPKIYPGITATTSEGIRGDVIKRVMQDINFSIYDTDGNGIIGNELMLVIVAPGRNNTAIVRSSDPVTIETPQGAMIQTKSIAFADNPDGVAKRALIAHEALHVIASMEDIYGPNDRAWSKASMASQFQPDYVQLDPMNKLCNGWIEPQLVDLANLRHSCFTLTAPGSVSSTEPTPKPILFYDSNRDLQNLFLVEYRTPNAPSGKPNFDVGLTEHGIAVWRAEINDKGITRGDAYITRGVDDAGNALPFSPQTTNGDDQLLTTGGRSIIHWGLDGILETRPEGTNVVEDMPKLVQVSPPTGIPALSPALWRTEHGAIPLLWAGGDDTGFELTVQNVTAAAQQCTIAVGRPSDPYQLNSDLSINDCWAIATGRPPLDTSVRPDDQVVYAAKTDGSLVWYQHLDWQGGSPGFANNGREQVLAQGSGGGGWAAFTHVTCPHI